MAFQLRREESAADGLRRLARKQLQSARVLLQQSRPPAEEAIHEARKSVKKVRAIMQLIETDQGRGLSGCRKRLRKVNRLLSRLRDADAMIRTLTMLEQRHIVDEHTSARLHRQLASHRQKLRDAAQKDGLWRRLDRELRQLRRKAKAWRPAHHQAGVLSAGIRQTYRRSRKALERCRARQRAEDFHEWRKRIKALRLQLRLIEPYAGRVRADVRAFHQAEQWLGDDHNIVMLCARLSRDSRTDAKRWREKAAHYQSDLRKRAIARLTRIYRESPGAYGRRVHGALKTLKRHPRRGTHSRRAAA